jgi:hypothetical protein
MSRLRLLIYVAFFGIQGCSSGRLSGQAFEYPRFIAFFSAKDNGYITSSGVPVLSGYDSVGPFSEGRAWCRRDGNLLLIDIDGNIKCQPNVKTQALLGSPFSGGVSWLNVNDGYCLLNRSGAIIATLDADRVRSHKEGFSAFRKEEKWGFCDFGGKEVVKCRFLFAGDFCEGLARVSNDARLWGYIRPDGSYAIPPQYQMAWDFQEGWAAVKDEQTYFFINKKGQRVLETSFEEVRAFSNGVAVGRIGSKWGWIDRNGEWIVKPIYKFAFDAQEGLIAAEVSEHCYGYMTIDGKAHIAPQFWRAEPFEAGIARVMWENGKHGIINLNGEIIWQEK